MQVLGYQVFFFILILLSALFGKKIRNIIVVGAIIFTLVMIFTNWLIILQLITITIAYFVTENYVDKSAENLENIDKKYGQGCITFIIIGGILAVILKLYSDDLKNRKETEIRNIEIEDSLTIAEDSINALYKDTLSNYSYKTNEAILNSDSAAVEAARQVQIEAENVSGVTDADELLKNKIIYDFISAENSRDFNSLKNYISNPMERFWNIESPTIQQIYQQYYSTWLKYVYTNTEILQIDKNASNYYIVKVEFQYGDKIKISKISFKFNSDNKIISIE